MPKMFLHVTFICFLLTALSGIWMRLYFISNKYHLLNYNNILHAHSHMAILGWTFLAVFIIFLALIWKQLHNKRHAIILVTVIFIVTIGMFIAFLYQGYATYSIIFSTAHIFVEYWMIIFIFKELKRNNTIPHVSKLFFKGGLITLAVSSIGPFGLGALAANQLRDTPFFEMAIYFYLHFQYNGWLYLMLIGACSFILIKKGFHLHLKLLSLSFWIYIIALFPGVFLSLLWYDFGAIGTPLAIIGAIGQLIGVLLFCFVMYQQRHVFRTTFSGGIRFSLIAAFSLLFIKAIMELGLLSPSLAAIVYDTRNVVIGYLHLTLLGFISMFILALFQITGIISPTRKMTMIGISTFFIGFLLNEAILFLSGLVSWLDVGRLPLEANLLLVASILLFIGILLVWLSKVDHTSKM